MHPDLRRVLIAIASAFFALATVTTLTGCENDGPAEEAGEALDDAADDVGDAVDDAVDEVEDAADDVSDG